MPCGLPTSTSDSTLVSHDVKDLNFQNRSKPEPHHEEVYLLHLGVGSEGGERGRGPGGGVNENRRRTAAILLKLWNIQMLWGAKTS